MTVDMNAMTADVPARSEAEWEELMAAFGRWDGGLSPGGGVTLRLRRS